MQIPFHTAMPVNFDINIEDVHEAPASRATVIDLTERFLADFGTNKCNLSELGVAIVASEPFRYVLYHGPVPAELVDRFWYMSSPQCEANPDVVDCGVSEAKSNTLHVVHSRSRKLNLRVSNTYPLTLIIGWAKVPTDWSNFVIHLTGNGCAGWNAVTVRQDGKTISTSEGSASLGRVAQFESALGGQARRVSAPTAAPKAPVRKVVKKAAKAKKGAKKAPLKRAPSKVKFVRKAAKPNKAKAKSKSANKGAKKGAKNRLKDARERLLSALRTVPFTPQQSQI